MSRVRSAPLPPIVSVSPSATPRTHSPTAIVPTVSFTDKAGQISRSSSRSADGERPGDANGASFGGKGGHIPACSSRADLIDRPGSVTVSPFTHEVRISEENGHGHGAAAKTMPPWFHKSRGILAACYIVLTPAILLAIILPSPKKIPLSLALATMLVVGWLFGRSMGECV
ncbi:hypothetical protein T492DRAFT_880410 [Pavlovales sp. CCMP2436]|nr:hypothetical protein T492DRAFT_880410 [Pavlovales sp. CCMP2436]